MDGIWDWQWCTEMLPDSYWFGTNGAYAASGKSSGDMFWPLPFNQTLIDTHCKLRWNVTPASSWIRNEYGGRKLQFDHSNIVFSSGGYDGWSSGGVATNVTSRSLTSIMIADGGHHLDLMFSHPNDPPSVISARELELDHIRTWVAERGANSKTKASSWGDAL